MKLSEYIASKAITASDFAREINRSVSTVTRIVNGESKPDWSTMARIEDATDGAVKPNDFLPATGETTPETATAGSVDGDLVRELARLLEETGLTEIEYARGDWRVRVAKGTTSSAAAAAPAPPLPAAAPVAAPAAAAPSGTGPEGEDFAGHPGVVTSPMVGVVYTAESADAPPFVKVGDIVTEGQTLLLIEAMKVFNPIVAPRPGKVSRILVGGGAPVEFGEPLIVID